MTRPDQLSLDDFVTAPRKRALVGEPEATIQSTTTEPEQSGLGAGQLVGGAGDDGRTIGDIRREEARKALRLMKRERSREAGQFVNVKLDRATKRRLKLAAFNADTSMQMIMEVAIRTYLDDHKL